MFVFEPTFGVAVVQQYDDENSFEDLEFQLNLFAPNFGTNFQHIMVSGTSAVNIISNLHRIFNNVTIYKQNFILCILLNDSLQNSKIQFLTDNAH